MGMDYLLRTRHLILCPLSQHVDVEDESWNTDLTLILGILLLSRSCTHPTWPIYNDEHVIHTVGPGCFGISGMNINIQKSDLMR